VTCIEQVGGRGEVRHNSIKPRTTHNKLPKNVLPRLAWHRGFLTVCQIKIETEAPPIVPASKLETCFQSGNTRSRDRTNAERQRRYRERKTERNARNGVTHHNGSTINTNKTRAGGEPARALAEGAPGLSAE